MKPDLSVKFCDNNLINPFILASAPPTRDYNSISNAFKQGWAGAITKSVVLEPLKDKSPCMKYYKFGGKTFALQNYEMGSTHPVEYWVETSQKLKSEFPDRLLLVSLFASDNLKEWEKLTKAFRDSLIDGFELNFSCPHSDSHGRGYLIGQNIDLCGKITKVVLENSSEGKIIMPKLPYLVYPNEGIVARKCQENGANAMAAINTIAGLTSVNPETLTPNLKTNGKTTVGGFSYHAIKNFAYLIVRNLSKQGIPVSASGGVTADEETIISFFAYGANHLQVCTEAMINKVEVIKNFKKTLEDYLARKKISLDSLRGCAVNKVVPWDEL